MTIKEILEKIRDFLANNQEIKKYCETNFGQRHKVVLGEVEQTPEDYTPSIVIFYVATRERNSSVVIREIAMGVTISNTGKGGVENEKLTWDGFVLINDLRELIEEQINEMTGIGKVEWTAQLQPVELYPLWSATIIFTLERKTTRRK